MLDFAKRLVGKSRREYPASVPRLYHADSRSVDTIGVHYSATIWRWYRNWLNNEKEVTAKYGARWFRVSFVYKENIWIILTLSQIWKYFLASSTIASRQGSATCYQLTLVKNINSVHRVNGIATQFSLTGALEASRKAGKSKLAE